MKTTNLEDKLTEVLKATEHPEQYTDEQLQELLADEECAEYYRLICDADNAYVEAPEESEEEIEAEWQRITRNSQPSSNSQFSIFNFQLSKVAAVVIAVLALSAVSYAAVKLLSARQQQSTPIVVTETMQVSENPATPLPEPADTIQVFQDAELQEILTVVANYYKLHTDYRSEEARHVRLYTKWNKAESVEKLVKRLNRFDKVNLTLEGDVLTVR
ncbi:MAG: DUF4974 domain-containing protein [Prevotella sp.]|nr:DUF4974 domain-containing protein [Prevotella sp.]